MSVQQRVVHKRRATITALPLYYSGHLLKKDTKEKDFKEYYAELRGAMLFLYKDDTQDTYIEKLDLEQVNSMELDSSLQRKTPTIFTLNLPTEKVQLKIENVDKGEEWRSYILTVVKKEIPSKLHLLPGQMLLLQEALTQEKRRNLPSRPALPPRPSFLRPSVSAAGCPPKLPACFFNVSRQEAERMLEANPECGGIILRPSALANNYALTLRQLMPSGPVIKNYRVTTTNSGFVIELETAVTVPSLDDVLKYFLEKTEYRLQPYSESQPYDTRIEISPAPECISIASPTPKTVPKAQVAPMVRSQPVEEPPPPPATPEEGEYVFPDDTDQKPVHLDSELQHIFQMRRQNLCSGCAEEEVPTYENQTSAKSHCNAAQWTKNNSTA
ncbi:signal-transducing adaptor protein 1-like [Embiotoca jacksoni]|uniref:signal-transducing adaptor protein 1-like n=1 Tax=Embiotoca jacksoni TaxID=100190 RepID=UPI0037047E66